MEVTATMKVHIKFYMILLMMQQLQSQLKSPPPLLIDLDGDGIETTTIKNGVYFDHENDGFAESSSWVEKIMAL